MNLYQQSGISESEEAQGITLEEYQAMKAQCEEIIAKGKQAAKLAEDPDFIAIIMEEYFTKEPKRLGSLMASGRLTPQGFDGAVNDLRSIGHLRTFLQDFIQRANIATEELRQLEEARKEQILSEEAIS